MSQLVHLNALVSLNVTTVQIVTFRRVEQAGENHYIVHLILCYQSDGMPLLDLSSKGQVWGGIVFRGDWSITYNRSL